MASGIKLSYEEVKNYFESQGCELLESDYKNARTKMKYRCSCGTISEIVFYSFRNGNRCKECGKRKISKRFLYDAETARSKFQELGLELLSDYQGASEKVRFRCKCGRESESTPNRIWSSKKCAQCSLEGRSGKNHYMWYNDREEFKRLYTFKDRCHKLVTLVCGAVGRVKNENTAKILGYDYKQLQEFVYNHPNWSKIKDKDWHIDHIFPIKAFIDHGITDIKLINGLDNLQPLDATENMRKSYKYDKQKFVDWLKTKGIQV